MSTIGAALTNGVVAPGSINEFSGSWTLKPSPWIERLRQYRIMYPDNSVAMTNKLNSGTFDEATLVEVDGVIQAIYEGQAVLPKWRDEVINFAVREFKESRVPMTVDALHTKLQNVFDDVTWGTQVTWRKMLLKMKEENDDAGVPVWDF